MNSFDYFFENTSNLEKLFLVGKEEISFKDLHSSSVNLAECIRARVGENKHVLLLSVNNLFFLKVYLAILKSGNICIPLDPGIEPVNFKYISDLTNPELLFATRDVQKRLDLNSDKTFCPDNLPFNSGNCSVLSAQNNYSEKCAEIIFTSGSTGKPKGVMISHRNLIANTSSIVEYLKLTSNDRMLVVLPFYYCYGLSLLHTHLRAGGSIVLNNSFIFLGSIIKNLVDYKCTGFAGVPSHYQILLRKSDSFKKSKFPDLKYVTQAGGKLTPVFIDEFRDAHPEISFVVMYGQTEATARLSWLPSSLYETKKGSIGKGIPGVLLKVVDEKGEMIKPGETGEIIAKGDNIMLGYFNDEAGTNETIRNGWLHTGDIGTVDEDGYIYLTARSKEIIKVRGKRISPKEIEAVIFSIPEIIDCTVTGLEDPIQGEIIKANVVIKKNSIHITSEFITQHCARHLALFKVPGVIEIREELSISATGKKIKKI